MAPCLAVPLGHPCLPCSCWRSRPSRPLCALCRPGSHAPARACPGPLLGLGHPVLGPLLWGCRVCPLSAGLCLAFTGPRQISVRAVGPRLSLGAWISGAVSQSRFCPQHPGGSRPQGGGRVLPSGTGKGRACALCPGTVSEPKPVFPVRCSESLRPPLLWGSWSGRCGSTEWPRTPCEEGGVGFGTAGPQGGPCLLPGGPWPARLRVRQT